MGMFVAPQSPWGHRKPSKLTKTFSLHTPLGMSALLLLSSPGCGDLVVWPDLWALLAQGRALGLSWDTWFGLSWAGAGDRALLRGSEVSEPLSLPFLQLEQTSALGNRKNWLSLITFYFKSFVYAQVLGF